MSKEDKFLKDMMKEVEKIQQFILFKSEAHLDL